MEQRALELVLMSDWNFGRGNWEVHKTISA